MLAFNHRPGASRSWKSQWVRCVAFVAFALVAAAAAGQSTPSVDAPQAGNFAAAWSAPEPWRTDRFYVQTSLATIHFSPDPDHVNQQNLLNVDYRFDSHWAGGQWLAGAAIFKNSFGQPSQYVYGGWLARPFESAQPFYFKITAGLLHGYKAPYDEKIPFNDSGVAPGIVPSVGYCYNRFCSEFILFGTAGAMLTLGATLP